jgi:hypothetical protein
VLNPKERIQLRRKHSLEKRKTNEQGRFSQTLRRPKDRSMGKQPNRESIKQGAKNKNARKATQKERMPGRKALVSPWGKTNSKQKEQIQATSWRKNKVTTKEQKIKQKHEQRNEGTKVDTYKLETREYTWEKKHQRKKQICKTPKNTLKNTLKQNIKAGLVCSPADISSLHLVKTSQYLKHFYQFVEQK